MDKYKIKKAKHQLEEEISKNNYNNFQIIKRLFELSPDETDDDKDRRNVIINICDYLNNHIEEINKNENNILSFEFFDLIEKKEKITNIQAVNIFRRTLNSQTEVEFMLEIMERLLIKGYVLFDYTKQKNSIEKEIIFGYDKDKNNYYLIRNTKIVMSSMNFKIDYGKDFFVAIVRFFYFKYVSILYEMNGMNEYFWANIYDILKSINEITEGIEIPK